MTKDDMDVSGIQNVIWPGFSQLPAQMERFQYTQKISANNN